MTANDGKPLEPEIDLGSGGRKMPVLGFGTAADPPAETETIKKAVLKAIELGYRHFDTASQYNSEQGLGQAIIEALNQGIIKSREELFITSKLWCPDAHAEFVLPALQKSLRNLKLDYLDLYLIHWPVSSKPGIHDSPIKKDNFLPMDFKSVWEAMEESQKLGLTKYIGVSNFSIKKLTQLLATAKITPAVNQVEVNPCWQQKQLIEFCREKGILVVAYSSLGAASTFWGGNRVIESEELKEIAISRGKTVAQVALRWGYEQGIGILVKSYNGERMKQNLMIFDWEFSEEERQKIAAIPQARTLSGSEYMSEYGPYRTPQELWDED